MSEPLSRMLNFLLDLILEFLPTLYHDILNSTVLCTEQVSIPLSPGTTETFLGGVMLGGGSEKKETKI